MNVIHQANELVRGTRKVCVALGMFDGVHLGHQRVLGETVEQARLHGGVPVAITFDQHPNVVVAPERTPPLIYTVSQRLRAIRSLGIEATLLIHFDRAFSEQSGESFIASLVWGFGGLQTICIGSNFIFGHRRSGNVALLKTLSRKWGFDVRAVGAVACEGATVSSTRIRKAIHAGDLARVRQMLGRRYAMAGRVVRGDQLGRKLGFPTANLDVSGLALPPLGVYAGRVRLGEQAHLAVMNLGYRPTLSHPEPQLRAEVHLLEFDGDLYEQELEFEFIQRLRGEAKFDSLEQLRLQIEKDVTAARSCMD